MAMPMARRQLACAVGSRYVSEKCRMTSATRAGKGDFMLRKANHLLGYAIHAHDGNIGEIHDFYFDITKWLIRYMVVDVGSWLFGRRVLIAPHALGVPNWERRELPVDLTKDQVKDSPSVDLAEPITREYETSLYSYYGWPTYWGIPPSFGMGGLGGGMGMAAPVPPSTGSQVPRSPADAARQSDSRHLLNMREVMDYSIEAPDGRIGVAEDFLVDDQKWRIEYLLVDASGWLPAKQVLLSTEWITHLDWTDRQISTKVAKDQVKNSPTYPAEQGVTPDYENRLYQYYGYRT
jgi:hypothetical protein